MPSPTDGIEQTHSSIKVKEGDIDINRQTDRQTESERWREGMKR